MHTGIKQLVKQWQANQRGTLADEALVVHLPQTTLAKVKALQEMYGHPNLELVIQELLNAAINDLETSFEYQAGENIISYDELGEAIYEDIGPTPVFLSLSKKHLAQVSRQSNNLGADNSHSKH